jgi:hypothetical protein
MLFNSSFILPSNQDNSVGIATGYGLDDRGSIPERGKRYFSTPHRPHRVLRPSHFSVQWVPWAPSLGVKRPGREPDHSPPCNAVIEIGGDIPSLPHTSSCFHDELIKHMRTLPLLNTLHERLYCSRSRTSQLEGVAWSAQRTPTAVNLGFLDRPHYTN